MRASVSPDTPARIGQSLPNEIPVADSHRSAWFESAARRVDRSRLENLLVTMVDIPSPTGYELDLSSAMASVLASAGLDSTVDVVDGQQASTAAQLTGSGSGASLLLYAPVDTHMAPDPADDVPIIGNALRFDMFPRARVIDDVVIGLGASNPKGQAACIVAAAEAIAAAKIPLRGDLQVGLGAGGMPHGHPADSDTPLGHGVGCAQLLDNHFSPDFAIIAKPSKGVIWQEVGLAWIRIAIEGEFSYAGTRHKGSYHNPILALGRLIDGLEDFFAEYTQAASRDMVAPQANLTAVRAGLTERLAYIPAVAELYVDLRMAPDTPPDDAVAALRQSLRQAAPGMDLEVDVLALIPGTATDRESWVVKSAIEAWESVEGRSHQPPTGGSGTTDGNVIRSRGIPTARIGTPRMGQVPELPDDFSTGMNAIDLTEMEKLTRKLIYIVIDVCTRTRDEVGLE